MLENQLFLGYWTANTKIYIPHIWCMHKRDLQLKKTPFENCFGCCEENVSICVNRMMFHVSWFRAFYKHRLTILKYDTLFMCTVSTAVYEHSHKGHMCMGLSRFTILGQHSKTQTICNSISFSLHRMSIIKHRTVDKLRQITK